MVCVLHLCRSVSAKCALGPSTVLLLLGTEQIEYNIRC